MKLKITILVLSLIITTNLFSQVKEEPLTLETKTGNIEGTLLYPTSSKKIPVVLIISGSGPTDRNGNNPMMTNNSLKMLAEGLSDNGIASLRFDKRGIAKSKDSTLNEKNLRFENYIEDTKDWVELLKKDSRFSEIIIIGHSEGSLIGMIASQGKDVSKFISIAGLGVPAGEMLDKQLKAQAPFISALALPIIEKLENGKTVDSIPQMLYTVFRPSVQPYLISWFKYDPSEEISKLKKPVLIIQGTTDIQVDVSNAKKLAEANKNAELKIIEGMNHVLKEAEADRQKNLLTYNDPDLPLKEGLIETITEFIKQTK